MANNNLYSSLDEMPLLNWHLLNKNNDFTQLIKPDCRSSKKISESELFDAYDSLLHESGGLKFNISFLYFQAIRAYFNWSKSKKQSTEGKYNKAFFDRYLASLNKEVEEDLVSSYKKYANELAHSERLKYRILEYDYHKFTFKKKKADLFDDVAVVSSILGYSVDVKTTTVSMYKSLTSQAIKISNNRKGNKK